MSYSAKILADSISPAGHRLTTFEVTFPRIVLAEFNTHRVFSRNSASSRAIPVEKMLKRVEEDPFIPHYWGAKQKGMQAEQELTVRDQVDARNFWREAGASAMASAKKLLGIGLHKQLTNRLLEPWLWHTCIVSATEWSNFFNLRDNAKAAPEIKDAAHLMQELYQKSIPLPLKSDGRSWHLPLVTQEEIDQDADLTAPWYEMTFHEWMQGWVKICCARCARVSYLTHDGKRDPAEDLRLYSDLVQPGHMSPLEHAARPMTQDELVLFQQTERIWDDRNSVWRATGRFTHFLGNVNGWVQHRKQIPGEWDILGYRTANG